LQLLLVPHFLVSSKTLKIIIKKMNTHYLIKLMVEIKTQNEHTLPTKYELDKDPIPENNQENHFNKS